jgi:hypothetical protein
MTRAYVRDVKGATLADYDLVMSELGTSRPDGGRRVSSGKPARTPL